MPEPVTCPACGRTLRLPTAADGSTVQCPECRHVFTPGIDQAAVHAAPPPSVPAPPRPARPDFDDDDDFLDVPRRSPRHLAPGRGATILTLGIVSLLFMPCSNIILGPIAWFMGSNDLARIKAGDMDPSGEGLAQAGRIIGIISTVLAMVLIPLYCLMFTYIFSQGLN